MTWLPIRHLAEVWRRIRADRSFPPPDPTSNLVRLARASGPAEAHALHDAIADMDALARLALEIAVGEIGCGEEGGNNLGPDVARYVAPAKPPQNWCAGFVGWCYETAALRIGVPLPFRRSLGAKRLGKNIGAVGRIFQDPAEARPGDAMVFHRGAQGSWMGHIAVVRDVSLGIVHTVEGNCGPKVIEQARSVTARERFAFFASVRAP